MGSPLDWRFPRPFFNAPYKISWPHHGHKKLPRTGEGSACDNSGIWSIDPRSHAMFEASWGGFGGLWFQKVHRKYLKKEVWLAWCSSEMLAKLLSHQGWIQIASSFHPHPYPSTCLAYPKVQVSHVVPPVAPQARACCGVSLPMPGYVAGSTYDRCPRRKCWPQRSRADPHHWWPQWDWRLRSSWVFGEKNTLPRQISVNRIEVEDAIYCGDVGAYMISLSSGCKCKYPLKKFTKAPLYTEIWGKPEVHPVQFQSKPRFSGGATNANGHMSPL